MTHRGFELVLHRSSIDAPAAVGAHMHEMKRVQRELLDAYDAYDAGQQHAEADSPSYREYHDMWVTREREG